MSDTQLLDDFSAWATLLSERFRSQVIEVTVEICAPSQNPATVVHFDGEEILARITFWADGSYRAEALDCATGDTSFSRHGDLYHIDAIDTEFEDFLSHVSIGLTGQ